MGRPRAGSERASLQSSARGIGRTGRQCKPMKGKSMRIRTVVAVAGTLLAIGVHPAIAQEGGGKPASARPGIHIARPLDADPRLNVRVTLSCKLETVERSLALLSKLTGIGMQCPDPEISATMISFRYQSVPLREVCDSLSALRGWRWKLDTRKNWLLTPS